MILMDRILVCIAINKLNFYKCVWCEALKRVIYEFWELVNWNIFVLLTIKQKTRTNIQRLLIFTIYESTSCMCISVSCISIYIYSNWRSKIYNRSFWMIVGKKSIPANLRTIIESHLKLTHAPPYICTFRSSCAYFCRTVNQIKQTEAPSIIQLQSNDPMYVKC